MLWEFTRTYCHPSFFEPVPYCRCVLTKMYNPCPYLSGLFNMLWQHWPCSKFHCLPMLGSPPSILSTVFQTIQLMKFFLQMAYGDYEDYYRGGGPGLPFQGVCQGNGAGLAIWLAMSIILMNMVWSNGYQVLFSSPISHWVTELLGLLYINDHDLFATDDNGCHPRLAIANLQCNINLW